MQDPIVTKELIQECQSKPGGWKKDTFAYLGIAWPPPKGWQQMIIGKPRKPIVMHDQKGLFDI